MPNVDRSKWINKQYAVISIATCIANAAVNNTDYYYYSLLLNYFEIIIISLTNYLFTFDCYASNYSCIGCFLELDVVITFLLTY